MSADASNVEFYNNYLLKRSMGIVSSGQNVAFYDEHLLGKDKFSKNLFNEDVPDSLLDYSGNTDYDISSVYFNNTDWSGSNVTETGSQRSYYASIKKTGGDVDKSFSEIFPGANIELYKKVYLEPHRDISGTNSRVWSVYDSNGKNLLEDCINYNKAVDGSYLPILRYNKPVEGGSPVWTQINMFTAPLFWLLDDENGTITFMASDASLNDVNIKDYLSSNGLQDVEQAPELTFYRYVGVKGLDYHDITIANKLDVSGVDISNNLVVSGNVGIGTTDPQEKLDVYGNLEVANVLILNSGTSTSGGGGFNAGNSLRLSDPWFNSGSYSSAIYVSKDYSIDGDDPYPFNSHGHLILQPRRGLDIVFATGSTPATRMVIKNNGNVGIGTTNPLKKLDVSGSIILNDEIFLRDPAQGPAATRIYGKIAVDGSGSDLDCKINFYTGANAPNLAMTIKGQNVGIGTPDPHYNFDVYSNTTEDTVVGIRSHHNKAGLYLWAGDHTYIESNKDFRIKTDSAWRMTVDMSGNVGIGTDSPSEALDVSGNVNISNKLDVSGVDISSSLVIPIVDSSAVALDTSGSIIFNKDTNSFEGFSNGAWGSLGGVKDIDGDTKIIAEDSAGADNDELKFYTDGSLNMIINKDGKVGIGTNDPSSKLHTLATTNNIIPTTWGNGIVSNKQSTHTILAHKGSDTHQYGILMGTLSGTGTSWIQAASSKGTNSDIYKLLLNPGGEYVGIGTFAGTVGFLPTEMLHLKDGNIKLSDSGWGSNEIRKIIGDGVSEDKRIEWHYNNNCGTRIIDNHSIGFYVGGSETERMRINSSGNVGIGTDSPSEALDVSGNVNISNDLIINGGGNGLQLKGNSTTPECYLSFYRQGGTSLADRTGYIGYPGINIDDIYINTESSDRNICLFGGNVGIGTNSPKNALHLYNTENSIVMAETDSGGQLSGFVCGGGTLNYYGFIQDDSGDKLDIVYAYNKSYFESNSNTSIDGTNLKSFMTFDSSGNVGIGADSPSEALDVSGNVNISNGNLSLGDDKILYFSNEGTVWFNHAHSSSSPRYDSFITHEHNTTAISARMKFSIHGSEALSIRGDGNVGIGTNDPAAKLHLYNSNLDYDDITSNPMKSQLIIGDSSQRLYIGSYYEGDVGSACAIQSSDFLSNGDNYQELLLNPNGGYVGIGTTDPSSKLHINGSDGSSEYGITLERDDDGIYGKIYGVSSYLNLKGTHSGVRLISQNENTIMYVRDTGVGIGTNSPSEALDVSGNVNISNNLDVSGANISNNLVVSGNVNISNKLDVSGVDISNNLVVGKDVNGHLICWQSGTSGISHYLTIDDLKADEFDGILIKNRAAAATKMNHINYYGINVWGSSALHLNHDSKKPIYGYGKLSIYDYSANTIDTNQIVITSDSYNTGIEFRYFGKRTGSYMGWYNFPQAKIFTSKDEVSYASNLHFQTARGSSRHDDGFGTQPDMTINSLGNVGIGITNPQCPLHVGEDEDATFAYTAADHAWFGDDGTVGTKANIAANTKTSIYAIQAIVSKSFLMSNSGTFTSSDERIKCEIENVPDDLALNQVLALETKYYHYKDPKRREAEKTIGFIAQEVEKIIPGIVVKRQQIIPNILKIGEAIWTSKKTDASGNTIMWNLQVTNLQDISANTEVKFYFANGDISNNTDIIEYEKDLMAIDASNNFEIDTKYEHVFVFGVKVNDFRTIKKEKIFALHHSAIQQVHKNAEAEKTKLAAAETEITDLKTKVTTLENTVTTLQSTIASMETRLQALESN